MTKKMSTKSRNNSKIKNRACNMSTSVLQRQKKAAVALVSCSNRGNVTGKNLQKSKKQKSEHFGKKNE